MSRARAAPSASSTQCPADEHGLVAAGREFPHPLLPRVGRVADDAIEDGQVGWIESEKIGVDDVRRQALRLQVLRGFCHRVTIHLHAPQLITHRLNVARGVEALLEGRCARQEYARAATGIEHTVGSVAQAQLQHQVHAGWRGVKASPAAALHGGHRALESCTGEQVGHGVPHLRVRL